MSALFDRLEERLRAFRRANGNAKYNEAQARLAFSLVPYLKEDDRRVVEPFELECRAFLQGSTVGDLGLGRLWETIEQDEKAAGFSAATFVLRSLTSSYDARRDVFKDGSEGQFADWIVWGCSDKLGLAETEIDKLFVEAFNADFS